MSSHSDIENDETEVETTQPKKESHEDLFLQYEKYKNKIMKANNLISSQLIEIKKFEKNMDIIINKMNKLYNKKKGKPRQVNPDSGFNKKIEVPEILINFLELEETILSRPKVGSILTQKLKDLGLKKGQFIQLDKDTITKLNLDESYLTPIKQTQFQTFLALFYKK